MSRLQGVDRAQTRSMSRALAVSTGLRLHATDLRWGLRAGIQRASGTEPFGVVWTSETT